MILCIPLCFSCWEYTCVFHKSTDNFKTIDICQLAGFYFFFTVKDGIIPYTKEQVEGLLESYGIKLKRNKLYDAAYAASMCKADFLGKSVPDEKHLAQYVKDVLDDADADEGYLFNRWYADQMFMGNPIDWESLV